MQDYKSFRQEWIPNQIQKLSSKEAILDVGAGPMPYKSICEAHGLEYISLDFGEYDVDIKHDLTQPLPFNDRSMENILLTEVLEHIPNPVDLLKELVRITDYKGKFIITCPMKCDRHQEPYIYSTGYFPEFYEYWAAELGCEIEELEEHPRGVLTLWSKK